MHIYKYLSEKDIEDGKEIMELITSLPKEGKEAVKNVLIGMNLNERANKTRQSAWHGSRKGENHD